MIRLLANQLKPLNAILIILITGPAIAADMDERAFAECISDSGARYYGTHWCPYCKKQNALFGEDARYLPYVECSPKGSREQLKRCKNIGGYPTWVFPGIGERSGVQSFAELERYTGCTLEPKDYFVD